MTEPAVGSWVIAALQDCSDRVYWRNIGGSWVDTHGCTSDWSDLVDPIDALEPPVASFVCPRCRAESFNPNDIQYRYCGRCHDFTGR